MIIREASLLAGPFGDASEEREGALENTGGKVGDYDNVYLLLNQNKWAAFCKSKQTANSLPSSVQDAHSFITLD